MITAAANFHRFVVRDVSVLIATVFLLIWQPETVPGQVVLGALLGLSAYLFHEWAHLAGAKVVHATLTFPRTLFAPFLFSFDSKQNSVRQFAHMTWPGFLATAVYCSAYFLLLPDDVLWADIARSIAGLLTLSTIIIEGPIALWVILKGSIPGVEIPFIGNNTVLNSVTAQLRAWRNQGL